MKEKKPSRTRDLISAGSLLLLPSLFWVILLFKIPNSLSQYFHRYSLGVFLIVLVSYYLAFRSPDPWRTLACCSVTMALFGLTLSYMWTSGYSDNKVIAGFLPYKDGAGYYMGATLILNGLPLENTVQAGWRPLFPGFLASLLFIFGGNLKWVLAFLVFIVGMGSYSSARQIFASFGILPASLYLTLLYFYIQPLLGLAMTELLGFAMGCFALSILWRTSSAPRVSDFVLGLLVLLLALSVRAGTFFILPLLALWGGRIFRGSERFSFKVFGLAMLIVLIGYYFANSVFARLAGVPEGTVFGNFAYSLYGQVQGGAGWYRAISELGTVKPDIIYRAAWQFFLQHPQSLLIGIAKAYRDFFLPGDGGIFAFTINDRWPWANYAAWAAAIFLLIYGLVASAKKMSANLSALLVAGFIGIFLSIPFLPPIDGGSRFYASTAPFFFSLPAIALGKVSTKGAQRTESESSFWEPGFLYTGTILLAFLTVGLPPAILKLSSAPAFVIPACKLNQAPFVLRSYPDSYADFVSKGNPCGLVPQICLNAFERNNIEKSVDDFYQALDSMLTSDARVRIIPTINLVDKKFHFFYFPLREESDRLSRGLISGCAIEIKTTYQSIYKVESTSSDEK